MSDYNPTPVTRIDKFKAAIAGLFQTPTPVTREEFWMAKTADRIKAIEEGGGGGGATYTGADGILVNNTTHVISPDTTVLATKEDLEGVAEVFYATYGVTTAQQIIAVLNESPQKPIFFKRTNAATPYPVVKVPSLSADSVTLQIFQMQTNSGEHTPQVIEYTVVNSTWGSCSFDMALETELDNVNPLMVQGTNYGSNPNDGDTLSGITRTDMKATGWRNITFAQLWTWIVGRASKAISSSSADTEIPTAKSVYTYITNMFKGSSGTGNGAFAYNSSATAGLTIEGDYSTDYVRQVHRIGNMVTLNFCLKGTAVAASSNWTYLGVVASGFRPKRACSITAQVYNGGSGLNEAAGGYIRTDGNLVIWCNPKQASNNYQVRVNVTYEGA